MNQRDFRRAIDLLAAETLCVPITAFLQGGLSVTGTWSYLDEEAPSAIVMEDHNGVRHVVPIETITSLREVREKDEVRIPMWTLAGIKRGLTPPAITGRKPGFVVFDEVG